MTETHAIILLIGSTMQATSGCGRDEFIPLDWSQRRDLPQAGFKDFKTVRPATNEEEAWLNSEEHILREEEEWAILDLDAVRDTEALTFLSEEAAAFETQEENALWMQAQEQVSALQEVEFFSTLEEQEYQELFELASAEDISRYLMKKSLLQGAEFLLHEESAEKAGVQELISIQQAAKTLLEVVDRAIHVKMEEERLDACNRYNKAKLHQREIEDAAEKERVQLKSKISKLKQEYQDLNEMLEREKDRTTCRICFTKPRDVLPLPCMHFDYCQSCLHQSQTMRNLCPTCRSPISGVLKYNLTIG